MARKITFGKQVFDDPGPDYKAEDIRQALIPVYPQLVNATPHVADNGDINFVVKGSTKG